jgi:hypothetical protein
VPFLYGQPLFGVQVRTNAGRECFGESQLPGRIIGSQRLGLAFQEREEVAGNLDFATIDVMVSKTLRACFLSARAARLTVEETTLFSQACSLDWSECGVGAIHGTVFPQMYGRLFTTASI